MDSATPQLAQAQTPKPDLTVAAVLIVRKSKLLVCLSLRDDRQALVLDYPDSKVEPGESPAQALARELREELGVDARIGKELFRTRHRYGESKSELVLIFFQAGV